MSELIIISVYVAEMPPDSESYYGFSYFAIQLNELLDNERNQLPCTDCRFRPDQRLLENGEVDGAEAEKKRVEQVMFLLSCNELLNELYRLVRGVSDPHFYIFRGEICSVFKVKLA